MSLPIRERRHTSEGRVHTCCSSRAAPPSPFDAAEITIRHEPRTAPHARSEQIIEYVEHPSGEICVKRRAERKPADSAHCGAIVRVPPPPAPLIVSALSLSRNESLGSLKVLLSGQEREESTQQSEPAASARASRRREMGQQQRGARDARLSASKASVTPDRLHRRRRCCLHGGSGDGSGWNSNLLLAASEERAVAGRRPDHCKFACGSSSLHMCVGRRSALDRRS